MTVLGLLLIVGLFGACAPATLDVDNTWVLLVASTGVSGWGLDNYSIQANVCHAYHTILATGISPEKVILMMPDDLAHDPRNPNPGKIINRPNGTDVYAGVKIDYRGKDVTPTNFLNVLSGNKAAMAGIGTGRVIEGDASTNLFVYLCDHGDYHVIYFNDKNLLASDLHHTIATMHSQKKYNKMVFYLETCLSGSMFDGMYPAEMKVYAMTASKPNEPANMCYCEYIKGACLAGLFSAGWMGLWDDQAKGKRLSFSDSYKYTKKYAQGLQHVSHYGDLELESEDFIPNEIGVTPTPEVSCPIVVPSNLVHLHHLKWKVSHAADEESLKKAQLELDLYMKEEEDIKDLKFKLLELFASESPEIREYQERGVILPSNPQSRVCYEDLVTHFSEHCLHPLRFQGGVTMFANACVMKLDTPKLKREMSAICEQHKAHKVPH
uniref:Legumain n=1 Tax=Lygus hesperus TaxID=30085 RepID=A0A0A9XKA8_LYGHE